MSCLGRATPFSHVVSREGFGSIATMAPKKKGPSVSPYTLSSMLEPLVVGNTWLVYDYTGGVNQAQIIAAKSFVRRIAEAD